MPPIKYVYIYITAVIIAIVAKVLLDIGVTKEQWIWSVKTWFVVATVFRSLAFASIIWCSIVLITDNYVATALGSLIWILIWVSWLIAVKDAVIKILPWIIDALSSRIIWKK